MKKTWILFIIFFVLTLIVPMFAAFRQNTDGSEMVKMFHSAIMPLWNCHLFL